MLPSSLQGIRDALSRLLTPAVFLSLWLAVTPAWAGSMLLLGAGGTGGAVGGPSYVFQGSQFVAGAGSPTTQTFSIATTTSGANTLVVVGLGVTNQSATITSVVYDPTGANVTLTQDAFVSNNAVSAIYSGLVSGGISSGSKNIVVIYATASIQFQDISAYLWTITGQASNLKQQSAAVAGVNTTISVTAGYFMFSQAVNGSGSGVNYATSTQSPSALHDNGDNVGADWTIVATNASFSLVPKAASSSAFSAATYH